jgi:hypothetical protein
MRSPLSFRLRRCRKSVFLLARIEHPDCQGHVECSSLGAYHDGHMEFTYRNVVEYRMEQPNRPEDQGDRQWAGHGDWLVDEVGLSKHGLITHEVCFSCGGTWYIECKDFSYEWQLVGPDAETLL